jgi:hypothetical protein
MPGRSEAAPVLFVAIPENPALTLPGFVKTLRREIPLSLGAGSPGYGYRYDQALAIILDRNFVLPQLQC